MLAILSGSRPPQIVVWPCKGRIVTYFAEAYLDWNVFRPYKILTLFEMPSNVILGQLRFCHNCSVTADKNPLYF